MCFYHVWYSKTLVNCSTALISLRPSPLGSNLWSIVEICTWYDFIPTVISLSCRDAHLVTREARKRLHAEIVAMKVRKKKIPQDILKTYNEVRRLYLFNIDLKVRKTVIQTWTHIHFAQPWWDWVPPIVNYIDIYASPKGIFFFCLSEILNIFWPLVSTGYILFLGLELGWFLNKTDSVFSIKIWKFESLFKCLREQKPLVARHALERFWICTNVRCVKQWVSMFESGLKKKRLNINTFWSEIEQEFPEKLYAPLPKISGSTFGDGQYEIPECVTGWHVLWRISSLYQMHRMQHAKLIKIESLNLKRNIVIFQQAEAAKIREENERFLR